VRLQNRRVLGATVLALVAALVLAGCGAGQITQMSSQEPAVNGAHAVLNGLFIRNAALQFPPNGQAYSVGSAAALTLTIVNEGAQDDELVEVTSDAASGAVIQGSKVVVSGNSLVVSPPLQTGATGGDAASVTTSPSSSAPGTTSTSPTSTSTTTTTSGTASASSSAAPTTSSQAAPVTVGQASIVLRGLKQPVWPGQTIKVTFVFRNAGSVTVDLPIAAPTGDVHTEAAAN
jgi:copper(I)-binding protein